MGKRRRVLQEYNFKRKILNDIVIGIVGAGYVGGAIEKVFADNFNLNVKVYDKYQKRGSLEGLLESDFIFLCLPTPYIEGHGFSHDAIKETCKKLNEFKYQGIVVIKSTVEPGLTRGMALKYNLKMVHNPEFLTARTNVEDFKNPKQIILGGTEFDSAKAVAALYNQYFDVPVFITDAEQSECMKLMSNSFYAVKIQIFNEFALLCNRLNLSFEEIKQMMLGQGWINEMHTKVPGPDGKYSYGNACFPKDTAALNKIMERVGTPNKVLKACIDERNSMRDD